MKQTVLAIVGMPGAGKSEAADFFRSKNIPVYRLGDQTDIGLRVLGKELTQENEKWYRENLRKELGMEAYAIKLFERISAEKPSSPIIVLDGLRSWEEYEYLSAQWEQLILVCIYARPETRYKRLSERPVRPLTPSEARKRDIAELVGLNMGGPIALADYLIQNETTMEDYTAQLETFLHTRS